MDVFAAFILFYFILLYFITHVRTSSGSRSRGCNAFDEAGVAYIVEVTRAHSCADSWHELLVHVC